jgi:hypothetical protein
MADKEVVVVQPNVNEDDEFFKDLLGEDNKVDGKTEELTEEQRLKNKNAEEARKRREAEAKLNQQGNQKPVEEKPAVANDKNPSEQPATANIPATAEVKTEEKPSQPQETQAQQVNKLGEQLVAFKQKYPNVDLAQLDKDTGFKKFVNGKLLGKQNFTQLYEEFVSFKSELTGQDNNTVVQNYQKKAASSTGSSITTAPGNSDVFSEQELQQIAQKLPFMSPKKAAEIKDKLKRSIAFYDKKK